MLRAVIIVCCLLLVQVHPSAADTRVIQVGVVGLASDLPIYLAEKRGYFKEEGLAVNLVPFVSAAKMIGSLGTGELDVGGGATSAALYNAINRGVQLSIVADKGQIAPHYSYKALMVRSALATTFKSLADLKGKRVGIVAVGAADTSVLHQALLKGGLQDADVNVVYLSFPQQVIAFQTGAVDVAISAEPDITEMLRRKVAERFAGLESFYPGQQVAVLLYGGEFSKQHELGLRFMRAYLHGARDYAATLHDGKITGPDADAIIGELMAMTGIKDATIFHEAVPPFIDPDGQVNMQSLQTDFDYFKQEGLVPAGFALASAVNPSFAREATASLPPHAATP